MTAPTGMFLNDTIGDCSIAAVAHACQVMFGDQPTDAEVAAAFGAWCQPSGCNDVAVLDHFVSDGLDGHWLGSYRVSTSDADHIAGLAAAGCSYVTFNAFQGVTGHCVLGLALDADWFTCFSWGQVYKISIADYRSGLRNAYALSATVPAVKSSPSTFLYVGVGVAVVAAVVVAHLAGLF